MTDSGHTYWRSVKEVGQPLQAGKYVVYTEGIVQTCIMKIESKKARWYKLEGTKVDTPEYWMPIPDGPWT